MVDNTFFDETSEQSLVKATIVAKYFWAWAKVIMSAIKKHGDNKIAYIDLFAGPGRYRNGSMSTPIKVLEQVIQDKDMREMLVAVFNDRDQNNAQTLKKEIEALPGIDRIKHRPQVWNHEVGDQIVKTFEQMRLIPTLSFVDPWGYKGLSLRLVNAFLKDWGCDCIFFFNYNRINMGLNNKAVAEHMEALFGKERAEMLRQKLELNPDQREGTIIEELCQALEEFGGKYVLPFCFKNARGNRTTHHLIFVSKNVLGYDIMKGIMANASSQADQGVPSFGYCPADERQPRLFALNRSLDDLEGQLIQDFGGQTLTARQIYERHNVGKPYILKNYKDALKKLEAADKITTNPPADKRNRGTFADAVVVSFRTGRT